MLNLEQFQRFMEVIRKLGDRVEKEHNQFLRDSQRIEDRSADVQANDGRIVNFAGTVDFQTLVAGGNAGNTSNTPSSTNGATGGDTSWEDDVWGSIFNNEVMFLYVCGFMHTHRNCLAAVCASCTDYCAPHAIFTFNTPHQ